MSILNFRKQRQYTKNKSGQYDLVSNWTSAETVYDRDGHCVMERLDNALLPMVDSTDNGKLLTVKNGGWAKGMVIPEADNGDDGKLLIADDGEWTKSQNAIIDQSKNAYTFGSRYNESTVGDYSVAEGNTNTASGNCSHAEGYTTHATGSRSHAEGFGTTASGMASHAEGTITTASGDHSHAEGYGTTVSANYSHAEGIYTIAQRKFQHVFGAYNQEDTEGLDTTKKGKYIEIVGNGSDDSHRSNARTLDWHGNEVLTGDLTVNNDVASNQYWLGTYTSLKDVINLFASALPNGIYLEDSVTLKVGESVTLQSLVIPSNASVDWTVDNTQDVSISNGVVTAIDNHVGRATVTAYINGTQTMAQCEIYITD